MQNECSIIYSDDLHVFQIQFASVSNPMQNPRELAPHAQAATDGRHHDQQRPQPELKPAASRLLRLGGVGLLVHVGILADGDVKGQNRHAGARLDSTKPSAHAVKRLRRRVVVSVETWRGKKVVGPADSAVSSG